MFISAQKDNVLKENNQCKNKDPDARVYSLVITEILNYKT